ncbi:asparaginase [Desulfosporosinus sp. Sb-LF]|uniref:asparaginase n=1 Tax=Desulfosporosinus sp. Sb-LF TaxID=2560027 RepID=UPI00107FB6CF|nr:asparaginase [Desulfosporosinus sp. Sb-LF]TGE31809.1 asparaginase [Desulfosporosinus sp. Sb-LF]
MSEILINVSRGPLVESCHRGDAVVVDKSGKVLSYIGDPYKVTFIRSAGKPLQTINVILSGAAKRFGFSDAELSIMCASHYGEQFHRETVIGILKKIGLSIDSLLCGTTLSIDQAYALELVSQNFKLNPTNSDCSGKHAGMLATCIHLGLSIHDYTHENHRLQKDILKTVASICEIDENYISLGTDGCSVPVYGMPLYNMALGFAKLANPHDLDEGYKHACEQIFRAMNKHPEMLAGTDGFCTELLKHTHGKLVGKLGAEGVYCIGVKGRDIGLAIKIEDGNYSRALWPVVMRCLEDLNVLDEEELNSLGKYRELANRNNFGDTIGKVSPVFNLKPINKPARTM